MQLHQLLHTSCHKFCSVRVLCLSPIAVHGCGSLNACWLADSLVMYGLKYLYCSVILLMMCFNVTLISHDETIYCCWMKSQDVLMQRLRISIGVCVLRRITMELHLTTYCSTGAAGSWMLVTQMIHYSTCQLLTIVYV